MFQQKQINITQTQRIQFPVQSTRSTLYTVLYSTGIPLYIRSTVSKKETNTQLSTTHPCRVIQTCTPITSIELNDLTLKRFIFWKLFEFIQFLFQVSWLVIESIRFHNVDDWVEILSDWYDWFNSIDLKNAKNGQRHITFSQIDQRNRSFFSKKRSGIYWAVWSIWLNHMRHSCELIESAHMYLVAWLNWLKYSSYTDS